MLDYRCGNCRRVFNAFTGTGFQKTPRRPSELVLILRGIAQGVPTAQLARELGINRPHLLGMRHKFQANAQAHQDRTPLPDAAVEADEMYKNAVGKRHSGPRPSRRAATARQQEARAWHLGHQPATAVGSGGSPRQATAAEAGAADVGGGLGRVRQGVNPTGNEGVYSKLKAEGRRHPAVGHKGPHRDWAKDLDGDLIIIASPNVIHEPTF